MKTNAELLELCEDGDRAEAIALKALDKGVPGAKQGRLSGEVDICDLLLGRAAREALPRLIAENTKMLEWIERSIPILEKSADYISAFWGYEESNGLPNLPQRICREIAALKEQTP